MRFLDKLLKNPKPVRYAVAGFIVLLLFFLAREATAETAFEVGPNFVSTHYGDGVAVLINERWNDRWELGIGLMGEQTDKYDRVSQNNILVYGQRRVVGTGKLDDWTLGIGLAYLDNITPSNGSRLNYILSIEFDDYNEGWRPDFYALKHISSAGTGKPNPGYNMINAGWLFGR